MLVIDDFGNDDKFQTNTTLSGPNHNPDRIVSKSFPDALFYGSEREPVSSPRSLPLLSGSVQVIQCILTEKVHMDGPTDGWTDHRLGIPGLIVKSAVQSAVGVINGCIRGQVATCTAPRRRNSVLGRRSDLTT